MASELLKNRALIQRLKEPKLPDVDFNLASTGFEELFTLPEPKPQELLDIQEENRKGRLLDSLNKIGEGLEDTSLDFINRQNFAEGTFSFGNQKFSVEIPNLTSTQIKAYQKGFKDLEKWLKDPAPENWIETFRTPSKKGQTHQSEFSLNLRKYIQGQPINARAQKIFDTVNIKNLLGDTVKDIQTYTPQEFRRVSNLPKSKKAAEVALNKSMKAASAVRDVFVGDPDADLEDVARGIFGTKKFNNASLVVQEDMLSKASDDTAKFLEAITANRKVKGFKPISADKLQDIIGNIEDNTKDFKFREGTIREYRFRIRDSLLGIKTESAEGFRNLRNVVGGTDKGKVVDEVFGLSATFKNAPGYVENVQLIDKKINNIKGKQIDKPFAAIVNAVKNKKDIVQYEGKETNISEAIKKFNAKSKEFSKKNKISTPQIFVGDNLDATKLVSNFNKYSPQAQKDILKNAKEGFILNATKPSTPAGNFTKPKSKASQVLDFLKKKEGGFGDIRAAQAIGKGAAGAADILFSAGPGAKGLGVGLLLEADPIITGMSEGKSFGQTARDTFIGSAIDAIPGVNLGSLNEDLIKLADTEEQRVGIQNLIDYQKDYDRFNKDVNAFRSYKNLDLISLDELGLTATDLVNMESSLAERFRDIQTRAPKVYNPDVISLVKDVARKEAEKRKANLEGIQGLIFGDRMAKDPDFIENQIQQILAASTGAQGATDSYADAYKFLPQEQLTSDELDERFNMEGGIMAANGGRIGFADGPMDPKRRTFMKIMAGIASLPVFSKFIGKSEVAKPIVKVAGSSTKMPDWFPDLINKVMFGGTGKKADADLTVYEPKELPGISIGRYDDGRVFVEGENEYGKKYMIEYEPPGYELIDEKTGKAVKKKGEFIAQEEVPVNVDPDGNTDFDVEVLDDLDQILGPDTRAMEEFATGKPVKEMKSGEFSLGRAEAEADVARDMDDYYED